MTVKREALGRTAAVKATMLQAHIAWAENRLGDLRRLAPHLEGECADLLVNRMLSTDWVPFRCLVGIDRAIAKAVGGRPEAVFHDLGRYSASVNLSGVYKIFISSEPHRFFRQMGTLHNQFQNFGRSQYGQTSERSGRITLDGYTEYSPVHCASALGYFEEALNMMHAPGPIVVTESSCQCAGDRQCVYEIAW